MFDGTAKIFENSSDQIRSSYLRLLEIGTSPSFDEKEIVNHLYEAKLDLAKYAALKKMFSN